ncbi:MAG: GNAT family N-acetyltransferase [Clostridium sp.]|uniref:GNAT family N-acetyltransferase n=1 Tax=Clostridium sp. TaxID=1506 RepID=UPI002FC86D6D
MSIDSLVNSKLKINQDLCTKLLDYNLSYTEDITKSKFNIFLLNSQGIKVAGIMGKLEDNYLEISYLWVDETLRNKGLGSSIITQSENIALFMKYKYIYLTTPLNRSSKFYEKLNYIKSTDSSIYSYYKLLKK